MILLQDRYTFEAEMPDGTLITSGGDIAGAVRVSLIPRISLLPRHDIVGQVFIRRFMRAFKRSVVGGFDRAAYFYEIERQISDSRIAARAARDERAGFGYVEIPEPEPKKPVKGDEYMQVVGMESCRLYVRHSDGASLITPPDFELYL